MYYDRIKIMLAPEFEVCKPRTLTRLLARAAVVAGAAAIVCACSTSSRDADGGNAALGTAVASGDTRRPDTDAGATVLQGRLANPGDSDRPLGPGDVLKISVPGTDEFNDCTVRISGQGTINVPLVGVMPAAGLNEDALAHQLSERLGKYVRDARVQVFVQEYRSNQVGVFGAVTRPGVYNIAGGDTLQDMI
jgi:polysaccharide biosynthesis/export protein